MRSSKVLIVSTSNKITSLLILNRISIIALLHASPIITKQINEILSVSIINNGHLCPSPNKILLIGLKFQISRINRSNQLIIIYKVPAELLICFLPFTKPLKWVRHKVCKYLTEITSHGYYKTIVRYHLSVELFPCFVQAFLFGYVCSMDQVEIIDVCI